MRLLVRSVGRLSDGIRLALDTGMTSGKTVDYVYRRRPSGRLLVGKWIDRLFLENEGWEAVRQRRANLETLLAEAVESRRAQERPVTVVDIASGPALYVLSTLERVGEDGVQARCRDIEARWLEEGRAEAQRRGLKNVVYEPGDAFDAAQLAAAKPGVVVSSGFYDWIGDDEAVRGSIRGVFAALPPGGWFVTTNQASHPDLELTHAIFTDQWGAPLRMKMRPGELVERWLKEAGFAIHRTVSDANGYYTVTAARKL